MEKKDKDKAKRLAEIAGVGGGSFEGEKITMAEVKDKDIEVLDFRFGPSQFQEGEFLTLQIKLDGEMRVLSTNAQVVMTGFHSIRKEDLPGVLKFTKATSGKGREYWTIE